ETYLKTIIKESLDKGVIPDKIVEDFVFKGMDETFITGLVKSIVDEMSESQANGEEPQEVSVEESKHSFNAELVKSEIISLKEEINQDKTNIVKAIEDKFTNLATVLKANQSNFE